MIKSYLNCVVVAICLAFSIDFLDFAADFHWDSFVHVVPEFFA